MSGCRDTGEGEVKKALFFRHCKLDLVAHIAPVWIFGCHVTEFVRPNIFPARVITAAVAITIAFFQAIADGIRKENTRAIFRAFFVVFTVIDETITAWRIRIAHHAVGTIIRCLTFIANGRFTARQNQYSQQKQY